MKRSLAILLLIIYASTTFGATISYHFCGDQLKSLTTAIFPENVSHLCCCEPSDVPMDKDCCANEVKVVQTDARETTLVVFEEPNFKIQELPYYPDLQQAGLEVPVKEPFLHQHHVLKYTPPIYLLNRVFRI